MTPSSLPRRHVVRGRVVRSYAISLLSPRLAAAFMTMAGEIKNRIVMIPQPEDGAKDKVKVGTGESLKKSGGGCC